MQTFMFLISVTAFFCGVADLSMAMSKRQALAGNLQVAWSRIGRRSWGGLFSDAADGFFALPGTGGARHWPIWRLTALGLFCTSIAGITVLASGAVFSGKPTDAVLTQVARFFIGPMAVFSSVALAVSACAMRRIRGSERLAVKIGWTLSLAAFPVVLWLGLMHAGTWLEWRERATPTAFGSEWFYAEAYLEYFREPLGRAISLACISVVVLPIFPYLIRLPSKITAKALYPFAAPVTLRLAQGFARLPRGTIAFFAAVIFGLMWSRIS